MNISERFNQLDENLKLDPRERDRAMAAHNRLGDVLVKAGIAKRTRLQGSFARKTMLPPLKDVDKVIELVDSLKDLLDGPGGPEKAMVLIEAAIENVMPGATYEVKQHALGIVLAGESFDFDAVPAFNPEEGTNWIAIADTEDDDWEPSNTYELIKIIADRNRACGGLWVHQVRMAKQAVKNAGLKLPGIHIEKYAWDAVTGAMPHPVAVAAILAAGARLLEGEYTEPTGVDRIGDRLEPGQKEHAQAILQRLAGQATDALRLADAGDDDSAANIWAEIFGDPFPKPDTAKGFLQGLAGGKVVTTAGTLSSTTTARRTRAWRP